MKYSYIFLIILFSMLTLSQTFPQNKSLETKDTGTIKSLLQGKSTFEQIILLEKLIAQDNSSLELYKMKAKLEIKTRDYLGAIKTLRKVYNSKNYDQEVTSLLGLSYFNLQDFTKAGNFFKQTLALDKDNPTARLYLSIITPTLEPTREEKDSIHGEPDIAALLKLYTSSRKIQRDDFVFLLDNKTITINNNGNSSYTIHCIVKLNNESAINSFNFINFPYNSDNFKAELIKAGSYKNDNLEEYETIAREEVTSSSLKKEYGRSINSLSFNFPELEPGAIIEYKIRFSSLKKREPAPFIAEHLYFNSLYKTVKKEFTLIFPDNLKLIVKRIGEQSTYIEETVDNLIIKRYSMLNPPLLKKENDSISLSSRSEQLIVTNLEDISELKKWYSELLSNSLLESKSSKSEEPKTEDKIKELYFQHQRSIEESSFEIDETYISKLHNIEEVLNESFEKGLYITAKFLNLLNTNKIKAYPALISAPEYKELYSTIPHPYYFNYLLIYIPRQPGIEADFFLDGRESYISYKNLPAEYQGVEAVVLDYKGNEEVVKTPMLSPYVNGIEENYKVVVDSIGVAQLDAAKFYKGSFAALLRNETSKLEESMRRNYFYKGQKSLYTNLEEEKINLEGYQVPSGNIELRFDTVQKNFTELFFDGKQILKEELKNLKSLFQFPERISTTYTAPFTFSYKRVSEYTFPGDYTITEHNLSSFSKENRYLYFNFEPEKIAENHFILNYELTLKKREISPQDLIEVNRFINSFVEHFDIAITLENKAAFDYEQFFEALIEEYSELNIYQGYISRLLGEEKLEKAEKFALQGAELFKNESYFPLILALISLDREDYEISERYMLEALAKDQENPEIYGYLITLYKEIGNKEDQEKTIFNALKIFPGNRVFIREALLYYQKEQRYEEAVTLLKELIEKEPTNSSYYSDLGYTYTLLNNFEEAEKNYLKAIELNNKDSYSLNNLAWLYCENNLNIEQAIEYAERACALDNDNDSFYDTLAEAYYKKGEYEKALKAIRRALEINPGYNYLEEQLKKIEEAHKREQEEE